MKLLNKKLSYNNQVSYLTFEKPENLNFDAWQFLMLDNGSLKRAYSIASSPCEETISFYVKKASENGLSKYLVEDIQEKDDIDYIWPFGHMKLEEDKNASYLLISTWSGLAPILSMYKTLIKSWNYSKIVNIYGERYKETIVEDVLNLMKSFEKDNVKNYFYLSKQQEDGFYTWHVQDNLEEVVNFLKTGNIKVYMCWKPAMVDATEEKLISLWIKKENILFEKF